MLENMRSLHPRGAANRGICVDAEGAMLGPDCVLVRRAPGGFRSIERDAASTVQKGLFDADCDDDWLFQQCRRIAEALDKGEIALAQIYGLRIPVGDLDDGQLKRLAAARFSKTFNPDEPRVPKGDPHGGEWTTGGGGGAEGSAPRPRELQIAALDDVPPSAGTAGGDWQPASTDGPPMKWEIVPRDDATTSNTPPAATTDTDPSAAGTFGFDFPTPPIPTPAGAALPTRDAGPPEDTPKIPGSRSIRQSPLPQANDAEQPPLEQPPAIPDEEPATEKQRNPIVRAVATWLGRAAVILGQAAPFDPRVRAVLAALRTVTWIAKYLPEILSYLDEPKTLTELQIAVEEPRGGYQIHHIVEAHADSDNPLANSKRFPDRINARENLVRIPKWKHVEISSWFSRPNADYGDLSPRDFLRGQDWEEQYKVGLDALRKFGVMK
jgi:hypothetical protein